MGNEDYQEAGNLQTAGEFSLFIADILRELNHAQYTPDGRACNRDNPRMVATDVMLIYWVHALSLHLPGPCNSPLGYGAHPR